MIQNVTKTLVVGALALGAMTTAASAGLTKQPGESVGLAQGAPLPEGVYFVNTLSWGERNTNPDNRALVNIPLLVWQTGFDVFGINVALVGAAPMIHSDLGAGPDNAGFYNPIAGGLFSVDLGGGFGASYLSGVYFNAGDKNIRQHTTTWRQDFAASYTADGFNLTANLTWAITFNTSNNRFDNGKQSNGLGLDLTATKTFGKFEVGAVGFGSTEYDVEEDIFGRNLPKTKQFAVGPLIGYNFGSVTLQAWLTRDVYARNTGGDNNRAKETRLWTRAIIPLYTAETPAAPLVTKY